jgi:hypothetical protein
MQSAFHTLWRVVDCGSSQSASILEQIPKLNLIWDLGVRHALWRGDMEEVESLINHREKICREFNDIRGLFDCANLRKEVSLISERHLKNILSDLHQVL